MDLTSLPINDQPIRLFTHPLLERLICANLLHHHHYIESDRGFSTTIMLWDYVFRTQPRKLVKGCKKKVGYAISTK